MKIKIIVMTVMLFINCNVSAQMGDLSNVKVPDIYYEGSNEITAFSYQFAEYSIGGKIAYCIEPGVDIITDQYISIEDRSLVNLTNEQLDLINLIAYYGYKYNQIDHNTIEYRIATQKLIWDVVGTYNFIFTTLRYGNGDVINTDKEEETIMNLVNNHYVLPSFANQIFSVYEGETIVLKDVNNTIKNYYATSENAHIEVKRDELYITPLTNNQVIIDLKKKSYTYTDFYIFGGGDTQKMVTKGEAIPVESNLIVNVIDTEVNINKQSENLVLNDKNYYYEYRSLENVEFYLYAENDIYDFNGNLIYKSNSYINSFVTDINGNININDLPLGNYYLEELSNDNFIHQEKIYFSLDNSDLKNNIYLEEIIVYNNLKKGNVNITKTDIINGELLPGTIIGIYDENNMLIKEAVTDEMGLISLDDLAYGKYYIKELEAKEGYLLDDEIIYFELSDNSSVFNVNITNQKIIVVPNTYSNTTYKNSSLKSNVYTLWKKEEYFI